jgi:hypothetical protein
MIIRILVLAAAAALASPAVLAADAAKAADPKAADAKPAPPKGPGIGLYEQTVTLAADGSAEVSGKIQLTGVAPGALEVPFAPWGDITDFTLTGAETKGAPNTRAVNPRLALVLPTDTADTAAVQFRFRVPAPKPPAAEAKDGKDGKDAKAAKGAEAPKAAEAEADYRYFSHRFMNGTTLVVDRYRVEVWLPEGTVIHTVPEAQPKAAAKDVKPRVQQIGKDGRQGALLEVANLRFGGTTSMRLEYESQQKSLTLLWVGLVLSVLYLFGFRDIVRPQNPPPRDHDHHLHEAHD